MRDFLTAILRLVISLTSSTLTFLCFLRSLAFRLYASSCVSVISISTNISKIAFLINRLSTLSAHWLSAHTYNCITYLREGTLLQVGHTQLLIPNAFNLCSVGINILPLRQVQSCALSSKLSRSFTTCEEQ
ncbi:Uncharacterised protein [Segatella copri]|nr:Uncharacterised protein [Segatella copri]